MPLTKAGKIRKDSSPAYKKAMKKKMAKKGKGKGGKNLASVREKFVKTAMGY